MSGSMTTRKRRPARFIRVCPSQDSDQVFAVGRWLRGTFVGTNRAARNERQDRRTIRASGGTWQAHCTHIPPPVPADRGETGAVMKLGMCAFAILTMIPAAATAQDAPRRRAAEPKLTFVHWWTSPSEAAALGA